MIKIEENTLGQWGKMIAPDCTLFYCTCSANITRPH
jgi:hypothetical protein